MSDDDRVLPNNPLADPADEDYGGNEGEVAEEDYDEAEDMGDELNDEGIGA